MSTTAVTVTTYADMEDALIAMTTCKLLTVGSDTNARQSV